MASDTSVPGNISMSSRGCGTAGKTTLLINDPVSGIFADTGKIHTIDHVGKHFRVRGPLNISRTPQGRPVYVQAGSSDDGRAFAARFAEAIFTAHQTLASAQEFYADIKRQAKAFDRQP